MKYDREEILPKNEYVKNVLLIQSWHEIGKGVVLKIELFCYTKMFFTVVINIMMRNSSFEKFHNLDDWRQLKLVLLLIKTMIS